MKILQIIDSKWAIGKLAEKIKEKNERHKIELIEIHPKDYRANPEMYNEAFTKKIESFNPDIIHFHYWDTAKSLSEIPACKGIKKILTHHNQRNLLSHNWENFDLLVVHTQKAKKILTEAGYKNVEVVQHGIDIERFKYNENYDYDNRMLGYVGRVVPWKGLYDILKASKELNTETIMMGRIDKNDYWVKCAEFSENMDIRFGTPDEQQVNVYHEMSVYIGNSQDDVEEGTLGFLEAMACGIPVITTPSGEANDIIEDGFNGILIDFENYESLKKGIERFYKMTKEDKRKIRENAWNTVRNMSAEVMARKLEKIYYKLAYNKDLVSVIIPTAKRPETIENVLNGYLGQTYSPIEIVVIIDELEKNEKYEQVLNEWKEENSNIPIIWKYTNNEGYGLAQARNEGIFLARGHYLIFNDDRFVPEQQTVEAFVNNIKQKKGLSAVWGDKGAGKRDFIENFFIIRKADICDCGMFNERINEYGGQSQELRERLRHLGFDLQFEPLAKSKATFGTKNKTKRRYELYRTKLKLWLLRN